MSAGEEKTEALVAAQSTALSKAGAKSLAARGRNHLRDKEEAEEWLRKGLELVKMQKHYEAFACFERGLEIEPEEPILQLCIATAYYWKRGVQADPIKALDWFRKAAEQGHAVAQWYLGCEYEYGGGVAQDLDQAVFWYRKSAEQGHEPGQSA